MAVKTGVIAAQTQRRQARSHASHAARSGASHGSGEGLRAHHARSGRAARRHDHRGDLREFKNRDELFIELGQTYWAPVKPRVKPGATFAEVMHAMAEATLEAIPERTTAAVGRLTGLAYTLTSPDLRARVREVTAGSYEFGAEWLRSLGDERELPMPPEHLVCVIHALIEGLVLQRILTPELCPDEVFFAAFAALAHHPAR